MPAPWRLAQQRGRAGCEAESWAGVDGVAEIGSGPATPTDGTVRSSPLPHPVTWRLSLVWSAALSPCSGLLLSALSACLALLRDGTGDAASPDV